MIEKDELAKDTKSQRIRKTESILVPGQTAVFSEFIDGRQLHSLAWELCFLKKRRDLLCAFRLDAKYLLIYLEVENAIFIHKIYS
jgi:hypothetical protein